MLRNSHEIIDSCSEIIDMFESRQRGILNTNQKLEVLKMVCIMYALEGMGKVVNPTSDGRGL